MNCSPSIAAIPIERFRLGAVGRGARPTPHGLPCDIEKVPTYSPPASLPHMPRTSSTTRSPGVASTRASR